MIVLLECYQLHLYYSQLQLTFCIVICIVVQLLHCTLYTILYIAVVIRSTIEHSPFDKNMVFFFKNRKPLGKVGFSFLVQSDCECENLDCTSSEERANILRKICLIFGLLLVLRASVSGAATHFCLTVISPQIRCS